jgi:hypothetical protein
MKGVGILIEARLQLLLGKRRLQRRCLQLIQPARKETSLLASLLALLSLSLAA